MDILISWIKTVAVFTIISTIIISIIPENNYKKYIKLFVGILMILLIMKPVGKIWGLDKIFSQKYIEQNNFVIQDDIKNMIIMANEKQYEMVEKGFYETVKSRIKEYVTEIGAIYIDSKMELNLQENSDDFGKISLLEITINTGRAYHKEYIEYQKNAEDEMLTAKIKKYFSELYNMDIHNIHINISDSSCVGLEG